MLDPKRRSDAQSADDYAAKRRSDRPANVDADAVARHRRGQLLLRDKL